MLCYSYGFISSLSSKPNKLHLFRFLIVSAL